MGPRGKKLTETRTGNCVTESYGGRGSSICMPNGDCLLIYIRPYINEKCPCMENIQWIDKWDLKYFTQHYTEDEPLKLSNSIYCVSIRRNLRYREVKHLQKEIYLVSGRSIPNWVLLAACSRLGLPHDRIIREELIQKQPWSSYYVMVTALGIAGIKTSLLWCS